MLEIVYLLVATLQAASVKTENVPLRTGCYSDSDTLVTLDLGAALTIRYSLAGETTPCYKVAVEHNGKTLEGYLPGSAIEGLDDFDKGRRDANVLDLARVMSAYKNPAPSSTKDPEAATRATGMIEAG